MPALHADQAALVRAGERERASALVPVEPPYPVADEVLAHLRA
ncbi:hypothetical protein ABZ923_32225 [Streptomyces sp. NPDC046881]